MGGGKILESLFFLNIFFFFGKCWPDFQIPRDFLRRFHRFSSQKMPWGRISGLKKTKLRGGSILTGAPALKSWFEIVVSFLLGNVGCCWWL
mgnify:CR=1 FL=1